MASSNQGRVNLKSKCYSLQLAVQCLTSLTTAGSLGHSPKWYFHLFPCWRPWRSEIFVGGSGPGSISLDSFLSLRRDGAALTIFAGLSPPLPRANLLTPRCALAPWTSIKAPWSGDYQAHWIQKLWLFVFSRPPSSTMGGTQYPPQILNNVYFHSVFTCIKSKAICLINNMAFLTLHHRELEKEEWNKTQS